MRNRQLVRELQLLLMLERARLGLQVQELALILNVCQRTVRRDLAALESAGVPLVEEEERRWRVMNWRAEVCDPGRLDESMRERAVR